MMKKIFYILFFISISGFAQLPDSTLQSNIDSALVTLKNRIDTAQATFFAAHGFYWQGKVTPSTIPADGASLATDSTAKVLGGFSWADVGITIPASAQAAFGCYEYTGPNGLGYEMFVIVINNSHEYTRTFDSGNETYRTHNWRRVF